MKTWPPIPCARSADSSTGVHWITASIRRLDEALADVGIAVDVDGGRARLADQRAVPLELKAKVTADLVMSAGGFQDAVMAWPTAPMDDSGTVASAIADRRSKTAGNTGASPIPPSACRKTTPFQRKKLSVAGCLSSTTTR